MGQKLVTIKFGQGSSSVFWNQKYNPVFKIEISGNQVTWEDITNDLYYCTNLTNSHPVNPPVLPESLGTERLTNSRLRKIIQKNQALNFFVNDFIRYYRISYNDSFLTQGQWEELNRGDWGAANDIPAANYIPLEYIESTGTQVIDLGITNIEGYTVELEFEFVTKTYNNCIFGHWQNNVQNIVRTGVSNGSILTMARGMSDIFSIPASTNTKYSVIATFKNGANSFVVNNSTVGTNSNSYTNPTTRCSLFTLDINGTFDTSLSAKIKLYKYKLYTDSNVVVQDFVPAKDRNGTVCMYDLVSGQFFTNAGTGAFVAGPVISN